MDKMSKTAKIIDLLMIVFFWLTLVLLITFCIIIPDTFILKDGTLRPYALTVEGFFDVNRFVLIFIIPIKMIMLCIAILIFRNILKPIKKQLPFDCSVRKNLVNLGWIFTVGGVIINLIRNFTITAIDHHGLDFCERFFWIHGYLYSVEIDMTYFFMAAVLFLLAYIFRYGEELQKQADETL